MNPSNGGTGMRLNNANAILTTTICPNNKCHTLLLSPEKKLKKSTLVNFIIKIAIIANNIFVNIPANETHNIPHLFFIL
ncbi:MAG: hypothetical protein ORN26_01870 [Candidatus Pacebacteria bacterium]|nr:hypothetical protein [Candidatus Paceibacterota bacterium]